MDLRIPVIIGLLCLGSLGVVGIIIYFLLQRRRSAAMEERLGRFTGQEQTAAAAVAAADVATSAKRTGGVIGEELSKMVTQRKWGENIARDLARADVKLNVGEYLMLHVICAGGLGLAGWWFGGHQMNVGSLLVAGGGVIGGLFIPRFYVGFQKGNRLRAFDNQLGDMLNLVVNGLRAGYSVMQALEAVGKELPAPISTEFRRVVQEMQIGLPMETALGNLCRRIPSKDLDFVVTAINVQREVGGNLAEILDTISYTIRERVRIKGEIATLTAQGQITGIVISMLPIGLAGFLFIANRPYMMQMFEPGYPGSPFCGFCMMGTALGLIGSGYLIVQKIVKIEV